MRASTANQYRGSRKKRQTKRGARLPPGPKGPGFRLVERMKECEKAAAIKQKIAEAREHLHDEGVIGIALQKSLSVAMDYIEFMLTPCEDDDDS